MVLINVSFALLLIHNNLAVSQKSKVVADIHYSLYKNDGK